MSLKSLLLASATILIPFAASAQDATTYGSGTPARSSGLGTTPAASKKSAPTSHRRDDSPSETIVVTSSRRAQNIRNVPESVSVVTSAQVKASAAQTLDQVLRAVPSVDLPEVNASELHPTADTVSMRGLGGTRALVLLDGLPLNDTYFGSIQWNRVPLEDVKQVEIVRGGDATLWGNYAMGGVINILTQSPTRNQLLVEGGGGSYGTYRSNLYASYVPVSWARFSVDYGYNQTLGFDAIPKDQRRPIDRKIEDFAHNVMVNGDVDIAHGLTAGVRINYNQNYQPIQVTSLSSNYLRVWTYGGHLTKTFADTSTLAASAFHADNYFWTNNTATPTRAAYGTAEYVQNSHHTPSDDTGGSLVYASSWGNILKAYSLGLDARVIDGTDDGLIFSDAAGPIQYVRTDIGSGKQLFTGGFGQVTLLPVKKFDVVFSARYQYYKSYDGFQQDQDGPRRLADQEAYSFLPRLSLRYHLTPNFALRAAGYEAFRAPTESELYRSISTPTGVFLANSALSPEKLKGGEFGLDFDFGRLTGQVTGFYNHIDNLITSRNLSAAELPAGIGFGTENINAGAGESRGMELEARWRLAEGLSLIYGYTHTDSPIVNNDIDPSSVGNQQAMVPHDKMTLSLNYVGESGWRITPQLIWQSRAWGDNDHTLPIDSHVVLNLTGSYPITPRIEAFGEIQNLFDKRYIGYDDGASPPQLGQPLTVFGGVRIRLF